MAAPGGGHHGPARRRPRDPEHPDGLRQVAGGARHALRRAVHRPALLLHRADQGVGLREVLRPGRGVRTRLRGHDHRRYAYQRGRADHLLHGRDPGQPGAARGPSRRRRLRGDGRIPLLRRSGTRLGLAGAAADPAAHPVPADERHPRQRRRHCRQTRGHDRHRRRHHRRRAPTGPVDLRIHRQTARAHRRTAVQPARDADLRRPLLPGRGPDHRAGARLHRRLQPRTARGHRRGDEGHALHHRIRQDPAAIAENRRRHPPRRHAAALPSSGRTARPTGVAAGHLRHGHARRRHQRADPFGGAHGAHQIRRFPDAPPARP